MEFEEGNKDLGRRPIDETSERIQYGLGVRICLMQRKFDSDKKVRTLHNLERLDMIYLNR